MLKKFTRSIIMKMTSSCSSIPHNQSRPTLTLSTRKQILVIKFYLQRFFSHQIQKDHESAHSGLIVLNGDVTAACAISLNDPKRHDDDVRDGRDVMMARHESGVEDERATVRGGTNIESRVSGTLERGR